VIIPKRLLASVPSSQRGARKFLGRGLSPFAATPLPFPFGPWQVAQFFVYEILPCLMKSGVAGGGFSASERTPLKSPAIKNAKKFIFTELFLNVDLNSSRVKKVLGFYSADPSMLKG
jgi:hypothetical protein